MLLLKRIILFCASALIHYGIGFLLLTTWNRYFQQDITGIIAIICGITSAFNGTLLLKLFKL